MVAWSIEIQQTHQIGVLSFCILRFLLTTVLLNNTCKWFPLIDIQKCDTVTSDNMARVS